MRLAAVSAQRQQCFFQTKLLEALVYNVLGRLLRFVLEKNSLGECGQ
jgi:hypothetical protein